MPAQTQLPRWGVKWRVGWVCRATFHRMNGSSLWPQMAPPGYCNLLVVFFGGPGAGWFIPHTSPLLLNFDLFFRT